MYRKVRCPVCYTSIECDTPPERCPACKEYILDKLQGTNVGINTATASGPNLKPLSNVIEDVY